MSKIQRGGVPQIFDRRLQNPDPPKKSSDRHVPKKFGSIKNFVKKFMAKKLRSRKNFKSRKIIGKKIEFNKIFVHKILKKMTPWKLAPVNDFGQNRVSNSWKNPDIDKCSQDILCYLDKCNHNSWHLLKIVPGNCLKSLVQNESVTAEILLIWTNVARANVAWTNVMVNVGICFRWSQYPMSKGSP